jgi:hypothetical protein
MLRVWWWPIYRYGRKLLGMCWANRLRALRSSPVPVQPILRGQYTLGCLHIQVTELLARQLSAHFVVCAIEFDYVTLEMHVIVVGWPQLVAK